MAPCGPVCADTACVWSSHCAIGLDTGNLLDGWPPEWLGNHVNWDVVCDGISVSEKVLHTSQSVGSSQNHSPLGTKYVWSMNGADLFPFGGSQRFAQLSHCNHKVRARKG